MSDSKASTCHLYTNGSFDIENMSLGRYPPDSWTMVQIWSPESDRKIARQIIEDEPDLKPCYPVPWGDNYTLLGSVAMNFPIARLGGSAYYE